MQAVVLYRMELELMEDGFELLSVIEHEVDDEGLGGVDNTCEITVGDGEKDVFHSEAVEVARHQAFFAESLDGGFSGGLTNLAFQFKMLHY